MNPAHYNKRSAEPWDIERGVWVALMMPGHRRVVGKVVKPLKSGWGAEIKVGKRTVTRDVGDLAVILDEHGNVQHNPARPKRWIKEALGTRPRRVGLGPHHVKAVRVEPAHKGALHRALGKPLGKKLTAAELHAAARSDDPHVRHMAQFALNVRGLGK